MTDLKIVVEYQWGDRWVASAKMSIRTIYGSGDTKEDALKELRSNVEEKKKKLLREAETVIAMIDVKEVIE